MHFAMVNNIREWVWGGTLPSQRKYMKKNCITPRAMADVPPLDGLGEEYQVTEADYKDD